MGSKRNTLLLSFWYPSNSKPYLYSPKKLRVDSLTHIALGAVIGETIAGKELGKKAILLGAAAQLFPDIDFVAALWLSPAENLVAHRGITHSLLFNILVTLFFAGIAQRKFRVASLSTRQWITFFGIQTGVHIFIDAFNAYGIGILEPFSAYRLSFHSLYVADPLFSIWIIVATIVLLVIKSNRLIRLRWTRFSLAICATYLLISLINKSIINKNVKRNLKQEHIVYTDFITTPTPFNNLLWYVMIKTSNGYYTGYRSVFDTESLTLTYFPNNSELTKTVTLPEVHDPLIGLSQQYFLYTSANDTLRINLLTFGQVAGWTDPAAPFVLECDLVPEETSLALLQEGRAGEMNKASLTALVNRIFNEKISKD